MNKESLIELQKIDCNCNDCKFMIRDIEKYNNSKQWHYNMQLNYFKILKEKTNDKSMRFEFSASSAMIHFGKCNKLNKDVFFIPNICQLHTQDCFEHRCK